MLLILFVGSDIVSEFSKAFNKELIEYKYHKDSNQSWKVITNYLDKIIAYSIEYNATNTIFGQLYPPYQLKDYSGYSNFT